MEHGCCLTAKTETKSIRDNVRFHAPVNTCSTLSLLKYVQQCKNQSHSYNQDNLGNFKE